MVKSTYQPPPSALQPLPPGWTEHKAPTGHAYYYNAETKESTYKRPGVVPAAAPPQPPLNPAMSSYVQHQTVPQVNLSDPTVANAFMAQYAQQQQRQQQHDGRGGFGAAAAGRTGP